MAPDDSVVHIGENSPEQVAYKLMHDILSREQHPNLTREIILDTYAECLRTVRFPKKRNERGSHQP